MDQALPPPNHAPQQRHAPRPLPLFLELVRQAAARDPELARAALAGLKTYEEAPRRPGREQRPALAAVGSAALRDHGGTGPPLILVPSLINPPHVLDLDSEVSLTAALASGGHRVLMVDWGPASARAGLGIAGHVEELLLPLLDGPGEPVALVGYCLGGTMAMAAAGLARVTRVATMAAPWHFTAYPGEARQSLERLWRQSESAAASIGALPMEVMQAGFWALDPERTVRKFAEFARLDPAGRQARRFVALEDWANEGEPLPLPAARELFEAFYREDFPGRGLWRVGGRAVAERPPLPALHLIASEDRIVPPATAPGGEQVAIPSGHVGMVVGRARSVLHPTLNRFLAS